MIPKEILDAIKTFQNNGFDTTNIKKAVLRKAELELGSKPIKKEKPKVVEKKTDAELISDFEAREQVKTIPNGKSTAGRWNGVGFSKFNSVSKEEEIGKQLIAKLVKRPLSDFTLEVLFSMYSDKELRSWFTVHHIVENVKTQYNSENDLLVRVEIYKTLNQGLIDEDKNSNHSKAYVYSINKHGIRYLTERLK